MRVVGMSFMLQPHAMLAPTRGGTEYAAELGDTRWRASYDSPPLTEDQVDEWSAWYSTLLSYETFWGYDLRREYPKAYPNGWGSMTVGGVPFNGYAAINTITEGGKVVQLINCPSGFIMSVGDYIAFDYGQSGGRALHRLVTAAVGPSPIFEVRPVITYPGVNTNMLVNPSFGTAEPNDDWVQGAGWTIPAGGFAIGTNVAANVNLSQSVGNVAGSGLTVPLVEGQFYRVQWSISAITSGSLRISLGGNVGTERNTVATFNEVIQAGSDPRLFVVPITAPFNGSLSQVNLFPAASLYKPAAKMVIMPDTYVEPIDILKMGKIKFEAIQVL